MNRRIKLRLWWNKLWIRKDEFHPSLNFDGEAYFEMNEEEKQAYMFDLVKRRNIAHEHN